MRCAIYIRVSTLEQLEEGFSIPAQKERLRAFCMSQGWTIVHEYIEEGYSAKDRNRPQLQSLLNDVQTGKFDLILVYRLDRLTRSVLDLYQLLKTFDENNVSFKSATEVYDTTTAIGRLFITLVAALAQWERENLAERVKFGTQQMAESGIRPGGPSPYGYKNDDGTLTIVEEEAKWVKYIFEKYITNGSTTIAKELNQIGIRTKTGDLWGDKTVRYILDNPLYAGFLRWNYRETTGGKRVLNDNATIVELKQEGFEPIISKEKFKQTQKLLKHRASNQIRSTTHYPFSMIVQCSECGHKYIGRTEKRNNREYRSYSCQGRKMFGICKAPGFTEEAINKVFLNEIVLTIDQPDFVIDNVNPVDIERSLTKLQNKKERAKELYIEGDILKTRYQELMNEYLTEEERLQSTINDAADYLSTEEVKQVLETLKEQWPKMDYESQKKAIHSIFESITIKVIQKGKTGPKPQPAILEIIDYQTR